MRSEAGFSLAEVLVVVTMISLLAGMAAVNLRAFETPVQVGASLVEGALRRARVNAIVDHGARRISPDGTTALTVELADTCGATTWTADDGLAVALPDGVTLATTSWSVCFSARGIANASVDIGLQHARHPARVVQVMVGGATRILE